MLAYNLIKEHLGDKRAVRSGVPYMNHIDEGLRIADELHYPQIVKDAYCLHPMIQPDSGLPMFFDVCMETHPVATAYALEYRNVANRHLATSKGPIVLSPLSIVNKMLVLDKIQNRKDFELYNSKHPRARLLADYFKRWFVALDIDEATYHRMVRLFPRP